MSESEWGDADQSQGGPRAETAERRRSPVVVTLVVLVVVGSLASLLAQFWTEILWFDSVDLRSVFATWV